MSIRKRSHNPDIFGNLEFKARDIWEKEDVWSPYTYLHQITSHFITYALNKVLRLTFWKVSIFICMWWRLILPDIPCIISMTVRPKSSCTTRRQIRPPHSNNGLLSSVYTFSDNCFWRKRQIQYAAPWATLRKHHSQRIWSCARGLSLMISLRQVMPWSTESIQSDICWQRVVLTTVRGIMSWRDTSQC